MTQTLHKVSFWIAVLAITLNLSKHTWLITSVAGQGTEEIPVSTEDSQVYCTAEKDCGNLNNDNTTLQSVYKFEWSSWCPPGFYLDEDVMLCSQKSCLLVSQETSELLQETTPLLTTLNVTNHTNENLVCVPVTSEYEKCQKLLLTRTQYDVRETNASIRILETNVTVPMGEFVILQSGIASVCITNETSNTTLTLEDSGWQTLGSQNEMSPACMPFKVPSEQFEITSNGTAYAFNYSIGFENHFYDENSSIWENLTSVCYELSTDFVSCPNKGLGLREEYQFLPNVSIQEAYRQKKIFPLGSYVLTKQEEFVVYCLPTVTPRGYSVTQRYLYGTACIISTLFLLVALLAHLFFPSLNYHAKALLCHIISMIIMYFLLAVNFVAGLNGWTVLPCYIYFNVHYVSIMGTFFWPNILAFDLWRVFSDLRGRSGGSNEHKRRKFIYQCAYSWGIPILLCVIAMTLDNNKRLQRKLDMPLDIIHANCWFSTKKTLLIFFNAPIVCILLLNTFYFVMTVYNIQKASKGTDILNKKDSQQLFKVFAKLFIVTGILWFAEVVAWFVKLDEGWYYFTDTMNGLQGVAIFLVYICNRRTLKLIRKRLGNEDTTTNSQVTLSVSNSVEGSTLKATDKTQQAEPKSGQQMEMSSVTPNDAFENGTHD